MLEREELLILQRHCEPRWRLVARERDLGRGVPDSAVWQVALMSEFRVHAAYSYYWQVKRATFLPVRGIRSPDSTCNLTHATTRRLARKLRHPSY